MQLLELVSGLKHGDCSSHCTEGNQSEFHHRILTLKPCGINIWTFSPIRCLTTILPFRVCLIKISYKLADS